MKIADVINSLEEIEIYLVDHWKDNNKVTLPKKEMEEIGDYLESLHLLCLRMERLAKEKKK